MLAAVTQRKQPGIQPTTVRKSKRLLMLKNKLKEALNVGIIRVWVVRVHNKAADIKRVLQVIGRPVVAAALICSGLTESCGSDTFLTCETQAW